MFLNSFIIFIFTDMALNIIERAAFENIPPLIV